MNLTKKEDVTKSLKASNINKDNLSVKEIKSVIENSLNPFNKDEDPDCLFNICTEKSCKKDTEDFLLNVESIGNEARKRFIQQCIENSNRFEERVKKIKSTVLQQSQGNKRLVGLKGKLLKQYLVQYCVNATKNRYG